MYNYRIVRARRFGLAAAVALAGGLVPGAAAASAADTAGSAFITNDTLNVIGTNHPDVVAITADAATIRVVFGNDPAETHRFNLTDFSAVSVSLGNGDDHFTEQAGVLADKQLTVDGGNGDDNIQTGDGKDLIFAGNGDDTVDAGKGTDTVFLGNGKDFFVWNPGEGSDAVDGGNGNQDVMQFNGADANETMSLSANGSRAVFLRDPAAIRMDMNDIEVLHVKALGGVDNVTINDVQATSIRQVNIDLSASSGGADQKADVVTVNATDQADRVHVTAYDGQVNVGGRHTDTQITGSETIDHLQVNTLDGNDKVIVDPDVAALIGVGVDLGLGQH